MVCNAQYWPLALPGQLLFKVIAKMHLVHWLWVSSNSFPINLFITMESAEGGGLKWHLRVTGYAGAWGMADPSLWPYPWILITICTHSTRKESISFQATSGWWMRGSNEDQGKSESLCMCIEKWTYFSIYTWNGSTNWAKKQSLYTNINKCVIFC